MTITAYLDTETFHPESIKTIGGYRYTSEADVLIVTWAIGDGPVRRWDATETFDPPDDLVAMLADERILVWAHNASFDRRVIAHDARLPSVPLERWRCTMTQALCHALPAGLDELCSVLGVPADQAKLADGKKLVRRFTQPTPKNYKVRRFTRENDPEGWARFNHYAEMDIVAMRECHKRMPTWNYAGREIDLWLLDQKINDRGFYVDRELVEAAVAATIDEKKILLARFLQITQGEVDAPSKREQLIRFVAWRFTLALENTQKGTLEQLLKRRDLDPELRELLEICIESNKTSTSKYARLLPTISDDDRFRGGLQFAGAGRTRRWGGRVFQPHNLPSRGLPKAASVDAYIACIKAGIHTACFDNLMWYGSAALRGVLTTPPGRHIVAADLSNIEGRVLAWVAGEETKLKAFREFDAGTGPDLYNITANMITGVDPWNVPKKIRNAFGKVPDLASGYAGGVAGYQTFAKAYGIKMADHWDTIQTAVDPQFIAAARKNRTKGWAQNQIDTLEISEEEWLASEVCKLAWRARHPHIVQFWYALEQAMRNAIIDPGSVHQVTRLKVSCRTERGHLWLQILLPSGRRLCYFHPGIDPETKSIHYMAMATEDGGPRIWQKTYTHGGKATGNCCQVIARDILADAMPNVEAAGYDIVLTVHDEIVGDAPDTLDATDMVRILATNPHWAPDLPLAAAGFTHDRYCKED